MKYLNYNHDENLLRILKKKTTINWSEWNIKLQNVCLRHLKT